MNPTSNKGNQLRHGSSDMWFLPARMKILVSFQESEDITESE